MFLHLLVEDDFIEEFVKSLPKDKVTIIEKEFEENKILLQNELDRYNNSQTQQNLTYQESMQNLTDWLKQKA